MDFLNLLPSLLQCGIDDNVPTSSSLLQRVPEVTLLKAIAGNWKINLFMLLTEGTFSTCLQAGLRWQRHLSASATSLPVCEYNTLVLVSWVNDLCILFVSYCVPPTALASFTRQHITCRAPTCHLWRHLTHQHTQRVTTRMRIMAKAEDMQIMATSAETHRQ